ncbi:MAG: hypothetical protein ACPG49_07220 [Chitinophagales bacterium]
MSNKTTLLIEGFAKKDVKYVLEHLEQTLLSDIQQDHNLKEITQFLEPYPTKIKLTNKRLDELIESMIVLSKSSPQYAAKIEQLYEQKQKEPKDNIVAEGGVGIFVPIILFILGLLNADKVRAEQERKNEQRDKQLNEKLDEILKKEGVNPESEVDNKNKEE